MTIRNDKGQTPDEVCKGFPLDICTHDDLQSWARLLSDIRSKVRRAASLAPPSATVTAALAWADDPKVADYIALGEPTFGEHSREVIEAIVMECRNGNTWLQRLRSPDAVADTPPVTAWTLAKWGLLLGGAYYLYDRFSD